MSVDVGEYGKARKNASGVSSARNQSSLHWRMSQKSHNNIMKTCSAAIERAVLYPIAKISSAKQIAPNKQKITLVCKNKTLLHQCSVWLIQGRGDGPDTIQVVAVPGHDEPDIKGTEDEHGTFVITTQLSSAKLKGSTLFASAATIPNSLSDDVHDAGSVFPKSRRLLKMSMHGHERLSQQIANHSI